MLLKLYNKNNNPLDLQRVVDILNDGGIVIYPTDTRYAIGCHGLKERAIEQICRIKGIDPRKNNLSIICYDLSSISEYAKVSNPVFKLMKRNLPGPSPPTAPPACPRSSATARKWESACPTIPSSGKLPACSMPPS